MSTQPQTSALAPRTQNIPATNRGVQLTTLEDMFRFATAVAKSGLAPRGLDKPEAILIAMQYGFELGFSPMQAIQGIAVINNRPCLYGDTFMAKIVSCPEYAGHKFTWAGKDDTLTCTATFKRTRGGETDEYIATFSVADAKRAKLWGKQGPWSEYPQRMLQWRACSWAARDGFADWLKGIQLAEEVQDYAVIPPERQTFDPAKTATQQLLETVTKNREASHPGISDSSAARTEPPADEPSNTQVETQPTDSGAQAPVTEPPSNKREKLPTGPGVCEFCADPFESPHKASAAAGIGLYCSRECATKANP